MVPAVDTNWHLLGNQLVGQRSLLAIQREEHRLPEIGEVYRLLNEATGDEQYVRIISVEGRIETFTYAVSSDSYVDFERRRLQLGLSAPLKVTFPGGVATHPAGRLAITARGTSNSIYNGMAALRLDGNINLTAEVKKTLPGNIGAIIQRLQWMPDPKHRILVAEYITAQKAEQLKQAKIQFLDTVGNAYIHQPPFFIYIRGNKKEKVVNTTRPGKAFQPAALKIVLALLIEDELANAPYRTIAQRAGVALETTGAVLEDLAQQGCLNAAKTTRINQVFYSFIY